MAKQERPTTNIKSFLNAVIGPEDQEKQGELIPIDLIVPASSQPRRYFSPDAMQTLTVSIQQHGILQPLLVRPLDNQTYEIVAGERRYRAAILSGLKEVPVVIKQLTDDQAKQVALIENLQREDLNPVEETEAILELLGLRLELSASEVKSLLYQMKHAADGSGHNVMPKHEDQVIELFTSFGRMTWESFVKNRLPLLNLPSDILVALREGRLEYTKAKAIAKVKDSLARKQILDEVEQEDLSLSQIKERINQLQPIENSSNPSPKQRFDDVVKRVKKARLWNDENLWQDLEALLNQIEALLETKT